MSEFGDGTYTQALLDAIRMEQQSAGKSEQETIATLLRILAYLTEEWR